MPANRLIVAGSFIDGSGAAVRRHVLLTVKDGLIAAIGPAAELPRPAGAIIDDFSHCTILPALVDASVSLARSPSLAGGECPLSGPEHDPAAKAALVARHIHYCHIHGVLGVGDSNDPPGLPAGEPAGMRQGGLIELRVAVPPGCGSRDDAIGDPPAGDFYRIIYSGNIEEETAPSPRMSPSELASLLRQRGDKKAVVVANGREAVTAALAAGCDAIEQGYAMGEDNLRQMAARGVLWIPSLLRAKNALDGATGGGSICCRFSHRYVAPGRPLPGAEAFWKATLAEQLAQLRLARELGVSTAVGTGAGSPGILHGEAVVEEIKLFLKAGYSLPEAINCASEKSARFFDLTGLGQLAVGRPATFLITRGTPQQLPRKLSYLEGIYLAGAPSREYRKNSVKK